MKRPAAIYCITFVVAACSLLYELLIAQAVSVLSANAVARYSVTVGVSLGAMGLGAFFCSRLFARMEAWAALLRVELALTAIGGAAVLMINGAHIIFTYTVLADMADAGSALFFLAAFIVVAGIGFFTGLELPLLIRIGNESSSGPVTNRVLAADYFGSLAAGVLFPLVLLPRWELLTVSFMTALANACVAAFILMSLGKNRRRIGAWSMVCALGALLTAGIAGEAGLRQFFLKRYYYYHEYFSRVPAFTLKNYLTARIEFPDVERISSAYQKIDVVQEISYGDPFTPHLIGTYSTKYAHDPGFPRNRVLFLNGDYQFWLDFEEVYHEYFAHVPVMLAGGKVPEDILVLGAGDGLLARELLKYPQVKRVTIVELDPKMIELARQHPVFARANKGALRDPRVTVVVGDAYHFVKTRSETYDAVYIDFPDPNDYNLSKLYSREFYSFVRARLKEGGYIVLDAPGIAVPAGRAEDTEGLARGRELWEIMDDTLAAAGFGARLPYFSVLEQDNDAARAVVRKLLAGFELMSVSGGRERPVGSGEREEAVDYVIGHYVADLRSEFIVAKAGPEPFSLEYREPGIPLDVLNEKRFRLAFVPPDVLARSSTRRKVNSIARPLLPNNSFWWIRLPY